MFHFRSILAVILLSVTPAAFAAEDVPSVLTGRIIDRVSCLDDSDASYALYLPAAYSPDRLWPVLFVFDPVARGSLAVELYVEAAERFGYIVAGSNEARNYIGWSAQLEAATTMSRDVTWRFAVDPQRVYTSGFSGGARLAARLAQLSGSVTGVIAHGAGFPDSRKVSAETSFLFVSIVGVADMNYQELRTLNERMNELGLRNRRLVFDGGHQWGPEELCTRAVAWMELQSLRGVGGPRTDRAFVAGLLEQETAIVAELEASGRAWEAYSQALAVRRDFEGLIGLEQLTATIARLERSPQARTGRKRESRIARREDQEQKRYAARFRRTEQRIDDSIYRLEVLAEWRREMDGLARRAERHDDPEEQALARRLRGLIGAISYEEAIEAEQSEEYARARIYREVTAVVHPRSARVLYALAVAQQRTGSSGAALESLEQAIRNGYEREDLARDPAFAGLQDDARFWSLVTVPAADAGVP